MPLVFVCLEDKVKWKEGSKVKAHKIVEQSFNCKSELFLTKFTNVFCCLKFALCMLSLLNA